MKKRLATVATIAACLTSLSASAQPYEYNLTWDGNGLKPIYKSLFALVEVDGSQVITTPEEAGTFSGDFNGIFDYTIKVSPDKSDPNVPDAVIDGWFHTYSWGDFVFHADSQNPYAGYLFEAPAEDSVLWGFIGTAQISVGTPIPEPASALLVLGGLSLFGALGSKRKFTS